MLEDVLKLPRVLDVAAVRAVRKDLLDRRGTAMTIDASDVERIGALGIELLISANRQWLEDDRLLQMTGMSDSMKAAFTDLGLDATTLDVRATNLEQGTR
jgi:chemotaxis protein CheX